MTALTRLTPGSIRVVPIPDHRPPPITPGERSAERPYVQDALAFDLANDVPATTAALTFDEQLPDPQGWGLRVGQALIEVMAGLRAPAQVVRHTTAEVFVDVARRHAGSRRRASTAAAAGQPGGRRLVVRRVFACRPAEGVAELTVVIVDGCRARAMAMRLEAASADWRGVTLILI